MNFPKLENQKILGSQRITPIFLYSKLQNQFFFTLEWLRLKIITIHECKPEGIFVDYTKPEENSSRVHSKYFLKTFLVE